MGVFHRMFRQKLNHKRLIGIHRFFQQPGRRPGQQGLAQGLADLENANMFARRRHGPFGQ